MHVSTFGLGQPGGKVALVLKDTYSNDQITGSNRSKKLNLKS